MSDDSIFFLGVPVGGMPPVQPTKMCPHIGGPCDGVDMPVPVGDDGEPVELHMVADFTAPNGAIPAFAGVQSKRVTNTYVREERFGDNGFEFVYRFLGTDVTNPNATRKAA